MNTSKNHLTPTAEYLLSAYTLTVTFLMLWWASGF